MKDFRVQYTHFFSGPRVIEIRSSDKSSAIGDALKALEERGELFGGNVNTKSLHVVAQKNTDKIKWKEVRNALD